MRKKEENRKFLLKILQNKVSFEVAHIALHGHDDYKSNFMQLFKLHELDNPVLNTWLKNKSDKYLSPDTCIQNELLEVMSLSILWSIARKLQSSTMFVVMADECVDSLMSSWPYASAG